MEVCNDKINHLGDRSGLRPSSLHKEMDNRMSYVRSSLKNTKVGQRAQWVKALVMESMSSVPDTHMVEENGLPQLSSTPPHIKSLHVCVPRNK